MTATALGTWRKPPLAYVVAELVISPYYSMGAKVAGLQDQLRSEYPKTVEAKEIVVDGGKPSAQSLWQLVSADQKHGVQLGTRAISLHATSYLHSTDFLTRWAEVLDAIHAADLGAFVERAGLRYIDLIVPEGDRAPEDYLAQKLQGISLDGAKSTGSMWAAAFKFDGNTVNLRVAAPAPEGLVLPPDFNALPLGKPKIMFDAERRLKEEKAVGFIDTDCLRDVGQVFNALDLTDTYRDMQRLTSKTFRAVLSAAANKDWQ